MPAKLCAHAPVTDAGRSTAMPVDESGKSRAVNDTTSTLAADEPDVTTVEVGAVHELDLEQTSKSDGGEAAGQVKAEVATVSPELDRQVTERVRNPVRDEHDVALVQADQGPVDQ